MFLYARRVEREISSNGNATYMRSQQQGKGEMHEERWKVSFGDTEDERMGDGNI